MRIRIKMKSFLFGVGRILDVGATFDLVHSTDADDEIDADALALSRDWRIVGDDIRRSIEIIESERAA